ncbi:MAG: HDOD domain-containing protein [Actinomycetota bacterium]
MSIADTRARLEEQVDLLPVLPTVVAQLMVLDRRSETYFDDVLALIEADAAFASRVLATANSAASSPTSPIGSVRVALARLGGTGAVASITAAAVSRVFVPDDPWEKALWRHAIQVAGASRALVELDPSCTVEPDAAYVAGLLHDVGRIIIFHHDADILRQLDEGNWESPRALIENEQRVCGITHPELGARACRRWHLPDVLVDAVARHHLPVTSPVTDVDRLVAIVQFADLLMFPAAEPGAPGRDAGDLATIESDLLEHLPRNLAAVTAEQLSRVLSETMAWADETCESLGLV